MSFGYYMNLEVLDLEIINESLEKMTDSNLIKDEKGDWIDNDISAFRNNLKNGWIIVLMLSKIILKVF